MEATVMRSRYRAPDDGASPRATGRASCSVPVGDADGKPFPGLNDSAVHGPASVESDGENVVGENA